MYSISIRDFKFVWTTDFAYLYLILKYEKTLQYLNNK